MDTEGIGDKIYSAVYKRGNNWVKSCVFINRFENADIRFSRELDLIDYINEQAGKEKDEKIYVFEYHKIIKRTDRILSVLNFF